MQSRTLIVSLSISLCCGSSVFSSEESDAVAVDRVEFKRDIAPLLQKHCAECHSGQESNGGLNLDEPSSFFDEADSGMVAIVPEFPSKSSLLQRVLSTDADERMPPEGPGLSAKEVQLLKRWIESGAVWPEKHAADKGDSASANDPRATHWSFQPVNGPRPPEVNSESWAKDPIDLFIQFEREQRGFSPVPDADPYTLVRRISYTLQGLPPTTDEIQSFVELAQDDGLDAAIEQWVDICLERPTYGQRWGRHWMDWVRYADTAGDNSDFPIPQAYLYRNYIIDAFQQDLPYDRFLIEQLAGDLLPADDQEERNRLNIATGYLAMARRFGSLVERYPWHLTIEDTIDNVGRTMMGLTISCARCHDHKFDPISTRDYYGMYGFFASTRYPFPGIELFQVQDDMVPLVSPEELNALLKPYKEQQTALSAELTKLLDACRVKALENERLQSQATLGEKRKLKAELDGMLIKARRAGEKLADHLKTVPEYPVAYAVSDAEPTDAAIQLKGEPNRPGAIVPRQFPGILGGHKLDPQEAAAGSGRLELARWIASPENPLTARVIVNRVWQRHFGNGIVSSTNDFGIRGQAPSHPELLDWLAADFVAHGYSIKHLHRTILTSRTYRLSSQSVKDSALRDPDNRWYWRFNRQRMDAESLHDSLRYLAGSLDLEPQTSPYPIPPQKDWEYTQHHPFKDNYPSSKRAVYHMTKRLTVQSYMQTFDGPDPNVCTGARGESVTPLQALFFVNDDFLHEQAGLVASRLLAEQTDNTERAQLLWFAILGQPADDFETREMLSHVQNVLHRHPNEDQQFEAWSSLTRGLLRLNQFVYIE